MRASRNGPPDGLRPGTLALASAGAAAVLVTAAQWLHHGHHTEPAFADLPGVQALLGVVGVAVTAALVRLLTPLVRRKVTHAD